MHVCVMGAGIIGLSTAYELSRDGHEVTVIDRQPLAANETSFSNAGMVAISRDGGVNWTLVRAPADDYTDVLITDEVLAVGDESFQKKSSTAIFCNTTIMQHTIENRSIR